MWLERGGHSIPEAVLAGGGGEDRDEQAGVGGRRNVRAHNVHQRPARPRPRTRDAHAASTQPLPPLTPMTAWTPLNRPLGRRHLTGHFRTRRRAPHPPARNPDTPTRFTARRWRTAERKGDPPTNPAPFRDQSLVIFLWSMLISPLPPSPLLFPRLPPPAHPP